VDQDSIAAGREQRVDAVLDGSIQKSGDRIRVTVRLVNVADGRQLWSENFDEKSTDIFRVQDSISQRVAAALGPLTGGEMELLARRDTEDPEAYSLYIKGRYFWNKRTPESLNKSIEFFNQAILRDPHYALAYVGLADAYVVLPNHANASMSETHLKARAYAQRALEINNQLPEAYVTLASIAADYWQWSEANRQFLLALDMNPNYATAHQWYGEYLVHTGSLDEALAEFQRALELDPTSLIINVLVGETLYHKRRYDESIEQCRKTLEMDRDFMIAHWFLAMNYQQKAMYPEAVSEFEKAVYLSPGTTSLLALLGAAYQKAGNRPAAQAVREKLTALFKQNRAHPSDMAIVQISLGEKEQALQSIEKAYQNHEYMILYIGIDPIFDPLRSEPRFADLVRRVRAS
jgi:tetratricopeptide (TPR) repeat protein